MFSHNNLIFLSDDITVTIALNCNPNSSLCSIWNIYNKTSCSKTPRWCLDFPSIMLLHAEHCVRLEDNITYPFSRTSNYFKTNCDTSKFNYWRNEDYWGKIERYV